MVLIPSQNFAQYTDQINSNRPGETMSAFSVGKTVIQLETGVYGITQKHDLYNYVSNGYGLDVTLRYGLLMERLELVADIQYQKEDYQSTFIKTKYSALKQTVLGAKFLVYDPFKNYKKKIDLYSWKANQRFDWHQLIPAVSIFGGANYVMNNNPYYFSPKGGFSPKAILITQNHFGDGSWVFVTNTIADYIGTEYPSYGYAVTLTKGFNTKWSGFLENQGYRSKFYSDAIVRAGAAYLITDDLQIDISGSTSLKNTPSILYGGLGFSWRYDGSYQQVRTPTGDPKALRAEKRAKKGTKKKKFLIF
jgi:hypothetical protein